MIKQIFYSLNMDNSIDFNLNVMMNNQSLSKLTSKLILEIEKLYNLFSPNAVIVQGDTTTSFSADVLSENFIKKFQFFMLKQD